AVFSQLNALKEDCFYEYAIRINQIGDNDKRETWNKIVNMKISIAAGFAYALRYLAENVTPDAWELYRNEGTVTSIGLPDEFMMRVPFTDKIAPVFRDTHPIFDVSDIYATMELLLDRAGTVYYTIAPKSLLPAFVDGVQVPYEDIPRCDGGTYNPVADTLFVTEPSAMSIVEPNHANPRIIDGVLTVGTAAIDKVIEPLEPEEDYVAYFVVKGTGQIYSPQAYCFRFTTKPIVRPLLTLENYGDSAGFKTNYDAEVSYILLSYNKDGEDRFNQLLQESFLSYLTEDPELREDYFAIPEDKETGITPNDYTVLEALKRSYYIGGQEQGSVFDCFAGQKVKDDLAASVRAQSSSTTGVAAAGKITLEKDVIASQDFAPYMSGSTEHLLLAVAQAIVNGELKSGDAFKGIQPLRISDDQAPVVVACDSTLEYTGTNANNNPQFSGELFVAFDEHIYIKMGTGEDHRYVPVEINTGSDDATEGFVKITNVYSSSSMQVEIDENDNAPGELTNHVTFKITNAIRNATIHFDVNLCDVHGNTRTGGGLTLKLQVNAWKDPTDTSENPVLTYDTKFVISPKGWDGVVE
ncbi:MAG: hypothetical protein IJA73_04840, partial [Oscillospiraceae bacterium]|nr:hypothetical protein [Oscillospiraceae bacterium]